MKKLVKAKKKSSRSDFGLELEQSLLEAVDIHKGRYARSNTVENTDVKPVKILTPQKIKLLQKKIDVSTVVFGELLGASAKTIQAWQSGLRTPNKYAFRLMNILDNHPEIVDEFIKSK